MLKIGQWSSNSTKLLHQIYSINKESAKQKCAKHCFKESSVQSENMGFCTYPVEVSIKEDILNKDVDKAGL